VEMHTGLTVYVTLGDGERQTLLPEFDKFRVAVATLLDEFQSIIDGD
jgi:hypothetical protein